MRKKKNKCPSCGSEDISEYVFGLYRFPLFYKDKPDEKFIYKGCCVDFKHPKYHCNDCNNDWGRIE